MSGGFDRLLTQNEFARFDAALRSAADHLAETARPGSGAPNMPAGSTAPVTRYQERVWLAQQQDPDRVMTSASAYRLGGIPDIARLTRALDAAAQALPELTMRYRFTDDGELTKAAAPQDGDILDIVHVESRSEAIALIVDRQQSCRDLELEPPFRALVIFCLDEILLGLLMHRIVEEFCTPADVLRALAHSYERKPLPAVPPAPRTAETSPVEPASPERTAPVGWLRTGARQASATIVDFGRPAPADLQTPALASRHGVRLAGDTDRFGTTGDPAPVIAWALARFAGFVCRLGGHERIEVSLPARPDACLGDDGEALTRMQDIRVCVEARAGIAETEHLLRDRLRSPDATAAAASVTGPDAPATVRVSWLTDPNRFFDTRTVTLSRVPLPTAEPRPDLELAIGLDPEGPVRLELVAGQALSSHAGALLLDLFCADLAGENPDVLSPETAPLSLPATLRAPGRAADPELSASGETAPAREETGDTDTLSIRAAILMEFREALAAPELGADDDFFDFGGHSLVATRIIGRLLHTHGIEVRFNDLFGNPTARALAEHARIVGASAAAVGDGQVEITTGVADGAAAPLALAQASLWQIYAAFGYSEIFNLPFALEFLDPVDEDIFGAAFSDLVERHAALRTLFVEDDDGAVLQQVVPVADLSGYKWFWTSQESSDTDRNTEAGYRFDLAKELPVRLRFLKDPETGRQVLSFLFHHLALDEWSVNLMMDELAQAYRTRAAGAVPVWSVEPAPFHEFARSQARAGADAGHLAYWTEMLADASRELVLFDAEDAPAPSGDGTQEKGADEGSAAGGWVEMRLRPDVSEGLYALAKDNGASLFNVVYAGIAAGLRQLGDLDDLVVGTSASGRTDPDYFDTIGYFTTVVAHRLRFDGAPTVGRLVVAVRELINGSMPYTDIPIDMVETALGMTPGRDHLFDVFIQIHAQNKLNGSLRAADGSAIAFRQVDPDKHESHLGLQFEVMEEVIDGDRSIRLLMSYQARRYTPAQVAAIRDTVGAVFERFSRPDASGTPLASLVGG